jgi:hypothetical protein
VVRLTPYHNHLRKLKICADGSAIINRGTYYPDNEYNYIGVRASYCRHIAYSFLYPSLLVDRQWNVGFHSLDLIGHSPHHGINFVIADFWAGFIFCESNCLSCLVAQWLHFDVRPEGTRTSKASQPEVKAILWRDLQTGRSHWVTFTTSFGQAC